MVGQILAIVAMAVFAAPVVLLLYFTVKYVIDVMPRTVRDDCTACGHAEHDRASGCPADGCDRPPPSRPRRPEAGTGAADRPDRPDPPPRAPAGPEITPADIAYLEAKASRPGGYDPGPCRACGHLLEQHSHLGCRQAPTGWHRERRHEVDHWGDAGWETRRRWGGDPCGCRTYLDPEAP
ncbi:hypothetical protein [Actinomadura sp. WMMB 499]|uniref:hypothetical protein n=1 Tax=Actinomadura sp. WMMB 499 TaxID=1219491 RepID=UPI001245AA47|nr:hypothetical protein [Actinomadura sp. WMMB 499]QFG24913.1 hypothetical protein F7P10_31030 [Actinomadura sp. WMMB 499]